MTEPISVRARFERFPATVKGAFIARGEDPDPHQIAFRDARIVRVGDKQGASIGMKAGVLDVPPHQDVFLPFEFAIGELEAGWYDLVIDLDVDGAPRSFDGGRRFSVPWPRGSVRRGAVSLGQTVETGGVVVTLDRVDVSGDQSVLDFSTQPAAEVVIRLKADGRLLPALETTVDEATGRGRHAAYPVMRGDASLEIGVRSGRGAEAVATVELEP